MWQKIKSLKEKRAQTLNAMEAILKPSETEKRDLTADENVKFNELSSQAERELADIQRNEKLYDAQKADTRDAGENPGTHDTDGGVVNREVKGDAKAIEYRDQLNRYLRGTNPVELRALSISGTGVVGDRPMYQVLVDRMKAFAGVRQAGATILPTSDGNPITVPTGNDTSNTGQLVAEATTDNTAADPTIANKPLGAYKFDSKWIKISTEMLQDAAFPIVDVIMGKASERIGRSVNTYETTGTGSGQPQGFLVGGTAGKTAALTTAVTYDEFLDLVHSVDPAYRASGNCVVQMHDTTLAALRKLKDGDGRYIFSPGVEGAPATIGGYRYVVNNDMPQISDGANAKILAFGDFSKYICRDVSSPVIVVADQLFIGDGLIGYRVFSRHDGLVADTTAIKYLKLAAS